MNHKLLPFNDYFINRANLSRAGYVSKIEDTSKGSANHSLASTYTETYTNNINL